MSNIIVIDTETNGLPITKGFNNYHDPKELQYYNSARVIELGYIIYSFDGRELDRREFLIKPDNFKIENSNIHGITFEMADTKGIPIQDALDIFEIDLLDVANIVAHNIGFDLNIIMAECFRYNRLPLFEKLSSINKECTMANGKIFLKSPRFPSLKILHKSITNKDENQLHRALDDSRICGECYFGMKAIQAVDAFDNTQNKLN